MKDGDSVFRPPVQAIVLYHDMGHGKVPRRAGNVSGQIQDNPMMSYR